MITFDEVMKLTRTVSSETAFDDAECRALYTLCSAVPVGGTVVEIGCQLGRTSSIILQCARDRFHSIHIDPWTVQPDYYAGWCRMAHATEVPHQVMMMRTDQAHAVIGQYGLLVDLLLVDGDHTAHGVMTDMEKAAPWVRSGGVLCAHDYQRESLPDVAEVLDKYMVEPKWEFLGVAGTLGMWRRR